MRTPVLRGGFALSELAATVTVCVMAGLMLLALGHESRRQGRLGDDLANLGRIGAMTRSYAADYADLMWGFSWRPGNYTTQWPDLQDATSDMHAGALQFTSILRSRGVVSPTIPAPLFLPHVFYSHVVLADYADEALPVRWAVSTQDRNRLRWSEDIECFMQNCFAPHQPEPTGGNFRWPFSSSFGVPVAFYDQSPPGDRIQQYVHLGMFVIPGLAQLYADTLANVAFPSQKVMMYDIHSRHFGSRQPNFSLPEARIPLLMSDGSVSLRRSGSANPGWRNPNAPNHPPTLFAWMGYEPNPWDPPLVNEPDIGWGFYRWTRMGIKGRDFGGPEIWP
jgi:hypothetical protein